MAGLAKTLQIIKVTFSAAFSHWNDVVCHSAKLKVVRYLKRILANRIARQYHLSKATPVCIEPFPPGRPMTIVFLPRRFQVLRTLTAFSDIRATRYRATM